VKAEISELPSNSHGRFALGSELPDQPRLCPDAKEHLRSLALFPESTIENNLRRLQRAKP